MSDWDMTGDPCGISPRMRTLLDQVIAENRPSAITGIGDAEVEYLRSRGWTVRESTEITDFAYYVFPPGVET